MSSILWHIVGYAILVYLAGLLFVACRGIYRGTRKMFADVARDKAGQHCPVCGGQGVISGLAPEYQVAEYRCVEPGHPRWESFRIIRTGTRTGFGVDSYSP